MSALGDLGNLQGILQGLTGKPYDTNMAVRFLVGSFSFPPPEFSKPPSRWASLRDSPPYIKGMIFELTDEQSEALARELRRLVDDDRLPLARRIRTLRESFRGDNGSRSGSGRILLRIITSRPGAGGTAADGNRHRR
jgi:hypothetical protein